ncbi:MAG TPA: MEMO1 family protein [Baekduia sp.]|nr:MEMO1 family protein [Baekduia sp.]
MSTIVAGICASHATEINVGWERMRDREAADRFMGGYAEALTILEDSRADVAVVLGSNHFLGLYLDMTPPFTIGVGDVNGHGEGETPAGPLRVDQEFAKKLLWAVMAQEIDLALSARLTVDHGITMAIQRLTEPLAIPVVPIVVNAFVHPLPSMRRCRAVGQALRAAIENDGEDKRVAIIATGGLSHHLPFVPKWEAPETEQDEILIAKQMYPSDDETKAEMRVLRGNVLAGTKPFVNEEWDREILRMVTERDWDAIEALPDDAITSDAGNAAHEIRAWFIAAAAVDSPARTLAYEPLYDWHGGYAVVALSA